MISFEKIKITGKGHLKRDFFTSLPSGGNGWFFGIFLQSIYTEENLRKIGLNERQIKAVIYVKEKGKITNKEYRALTSLSDEGARVDLSVLVERDILESKGSERSTHYILKELGN